MSYPAFHDHKEPSSNHDINKASKKEQGINVSTKKSKVHLKGKVQSTELLRVKVKMASSEEKQAREQRSIRLAHADSLLLPIPAKAIQMKEVLLTLPTLSTTPGAGRTSSGKAAKLEVDFSLTLSNLPYGLQPNEGELFYDSLSDFIVEDSASELDVCPLRSGLKDQKRSPKKNFKKPEYRASSPEPTFSKPKQPPTVIDLTSPLKDSKSVPNHDPSLVKRTLRFASPEPKDSFDEDIEAKLGLYVNKFSHNVHSISNKYVVRLRDQRHQPSAPKAPVSLPHPKVLRNLDCNLLPNRREYLHRLIGPA